MTLKSLLLLLPLLALASCRPSAPTEPAAAAPRARPEVLVANYPLQYLARRLAGEAADIVFPAPADEDPAFWQPDDAALARFQAADAILMNGATYSKWAEKASLPESKLVDTSKAFAAAYIQIQDAGRHSHGPGGEHSHAGTAFTTWLDFQQARQQAGAVADALRPLLPAAAAAALDANLQALQADLARLDARLLAVGKRIARAPLVASHPVYQYLARRYGLNLQAVLWEPETVPDEAALADLKAILAKHPAKWMLWEGEPAPASVAKLQALGVASLVFDPCGNAPEQGDFLTVMQANVEALERAFP